MALGDVCTFSSFQMHKVVKPHLSVLVNSSDELIKETTFPQILLLSFFHKFSILPGKVSLPKEASGKVDCQALVDQLRECQTLQNQASCLHLLHTLK